MRKEGVLGFLDACVKGLLGVGRANRNGGLGEDAAGVDLRDDEVDGATGGGLTGGEGVTDGVAAFELGEEGRVDVEDAVSEGGEGGVLQDAHEAGEHDDVGAGGEEVVVDGLLGGFGGAKRMGTTVDDGGGEMIGLREGEEGGVGLV